MNKRKYCMLGRVDRRAVLLKKIVVMQDRAPARGVDDGIVESQELPPEFVFTEYDEIFEPLFVEEDEHTLPALRESHLVGDDLNVFLEIVDWPMMTKEGVKRLLRCVNRYRSIPLTLHKLNLWKEEYQSIPQRRIASCQILELRTLLGWILSVPMYIENLHYHYEERYVLSLTILMC